MKHSFGGEWTREKIGRVREYLVAYMTALKNQPFKLVYIDAFAGTGYIHEKEENSQPFLPEFTEDDVKDFFDGSTRTALQLQNPFHTYIFIEKEKDRVSELDKLKIEFPNLADRIFPVEREANEYIQDLCKKDWLKSNRRGVMFLDPYGMQVKWETIEAIANTKAIDLWLLFPLGVAVNRLLKNDGRISPKVKLRLDNMFGNSEWQEFFFRDDAQQNLFDQTPKLVKSINMNGIAEYFNNRLDAIFEKVANNPLRLMNSRNNPLYLLCFASGNPKGAKPAVRIAQHILKEKKVAYNTSIEWSSSSWNPITGCNKISPGCKHCYAERLSKRLKAMGQANYKNGFKLTLQPQMLELPLSWKKPQTIFVNSMSDLFHKDVPLEYIQQVFDVMKRAHWHRFQVLTKRADRLAELSKQLEWSPNIWMGVSVENQKYVERIDELKRTNANIKFLSLEPLLGALKNLNLNGIDWVIVGGESGYGARPIKEEWVLEIREQCQSFGVPFFFKQWGGVNKKKNGRLLEDKTWNEMPIQSV